MDSLAACKAPSCKRKVKARGYCGTHYQIARLTGELPHTGSGRKTEDIAVRLRNKTNKEGPNGCWLWTGACDSNGYGIVWFAGRNWRASHVAFLLSRGERLTALRGFICHTCDNPKCVNPNHLFLGTVRDNMQDAVAKKRHAHGVRHGMVKLSESQAQEAKKRLSKGETCTAIAKDFGVTLSAIHDIKRGKNWKHLKP